jgi:hypothetical protein
MIMTEIFYRGFSEKEREDLERYLARIVENLEGAEAR